MKKYNRSLTTGRGASLAAALADYHADPTPDRLSAVCDALIERCASVSAEAVVSAHEQVEGMRVELADLWAQLDALRGDGAKAGN
jgi:hypothetical protein